jgi:hypothetical protein
MKTKSKTTKRAPSPASNQGHHLTAGARKRGQLGPDAATPPAAAAMAPIESLSAIGHAPTNVYTFKCTAIDAATQVALPMPNTLATFRLVVDGTIERVIDDAPCVIEGADIACHVRDFARTGVFLGRFELSTPQGIRKIGPFIYRIGA